MRLERAARDGLWCAVVVALGLACSIRAGAAEKPVLNVYSWADYIGPNTVADFQRETGIKVNFDFYDSSEIVDTKLMAGGSSYDVVFHSATYTARLIPVGILQPLDRARLHNLGNLDPDILKHFEVFDPGIRYGVPYMWGSTGFTYNVDKIRERMPDAPVDSAALVFNPAVVSRFADCGVTLVDAATDVIPMALLYLGFSAESVEPAELAAAERLLLSIRPYIRYFSSQQMLIDLPNEEVCIAMSWSGDYSVAQRNAREAGSKVRLAFDMPKEGMTLWLDAAYIPADAPHPGNAHIFLDYLLRPEVMAAISNFVGYASANRAATALVHASLRADPAIYPDAAVMARLHPVPMLSPKTERLRTRLWSRVKTGVRE